MEQGGFTVFYSWQSDTPGRDNRNFIEASLRIAIDSVQKNGNIEQSPRLDKDTQDVPGLPDIAHTILEKIRSCDVFVADISYISRTKEGTDAGKLVPNPNVMIELGYALSELGWERIILVLNAASGPPDRLPFDLRNRRWPFAYELSGETDEEERKKVRKRLAAQLEGAIEAIAKLPPREKRGSIEGRLSSLEAMVSSLNSISAQHATLASLIEAARTDVGHPIKKSSRDECKKNLEILVSRLSSGDFHGVTFQQGMVALSIVPSEPLISQSIFETNHDTVLRLGLQPMYASGWDHKIFGDRFVLTSGLKNGSIDAATEVTESGVISAVGHRVLAIDPSFWEHMGKVPPKDVISIPSLAFEKVVIESVTKYIKTMTQLGAEGPWYVGLRLVNVLQSVLYAYETFTLGGRVFQGSEIAPPIIDIAKESDVSNEQTIAHGMRPIFDYIWREHGFPHSLNYAQTGDWVGR